MKKPQRVLYQKIGSQWFVFTEKGDEILYAVVPKNDSTHDFSGELVEITYDSPSPTHYLDGKLPVEITN